MQHGQGINFDYLTLYWLASFTLQSDSYIDFGAYV